jgi:ActR/RegA family two-component response regulator
MGYDKIKNTLSSPQQVKLDALKRRACELLDHTPRFKFFTLHGTAHLNSLFEILNLFHEAGFNLKQDEIFLISCAICAHDLGMVVKLQEQDISYILDGRNQSPDPASLENYIRETHHELIDSYLQQDFTFMVGLGFTPQEIADVRSISKCHRKVDLSKQSSKHKKLGALLRLIDELDLSPTRAPLDIFMNLSNEMDSTATWHWFKHNIVSPWELSDTVDNSVINGRSELTFNLRVQPSRRDSIHYWLTQIKRPILKALMDDGVKAILRQEFGINVSIQTNPSESRVNNLGDSWSRLEEKALAENSKIVLIVDDEFRKIEDTFIPLMDEYTVSSAPNAKAALEQINARKVDFVIVDMQIGSGGLWTEEETNDFKFTGLRLIDEIRSIKPDIGIGVLTGSKYKLEEVKDLNPHFFLRKPADPDDLMAEINSFFHHELQH